MPEQMEGGISPRVFSDADLTAPAVIRVPQVQAFLEEAQSIFPPKGQMDLLAALLNEHLHVHSGDICIQQTVRQEPDGRWMVALGVLGQDWPGMSNAVLGIVHHRVANIAFMKGLTLSLNGASLGVVVLAFHLEAADYHEYERSNKEILGLIRDAARESSSKHQLLEDEAVKLEIHARVVERIRQKCAARALEALTGESGEALKFISSRSRAYLEDRKIEDLAEIIMDSERFQRSVREGRREQVLRIRNFVTRTEHLTGITFVTREVLLSIEDFLKTLNFIVPGHMIRHHKSLVTPDGIFVYRLEIVDRYGNPLQPAVIRQIEGTLRKLIHSAFSSKISRIKAVGGVEHYARALIPFLMQEYRKTGMPQVYLKVDHKSEFALDLRVMAVVPTGEMSRLYRAVNGFESLPGVEVFAALPPKRYSGDVQIDLIRLQILLAEYSSLDDLFATLKKVLKENYGEIRDFDQGFREMDLQILGRLQEHFAFQNNPGLVTDIFFGFDDLYRIQMPFELLAAAVELVVEGIEEIRTQKHREPLLRGRRVEETDCLVLLISHASDRTCLAPVMDALADCHFYFNKVRWNQWTHTILVVDRVGDRPCGELQQRVGHILEAHWQKTRRRRTP